MKRRKEKRQQTVRCPYCGAIADLRPAAEIYSDESAMGEAVCMPQLPWLQVLCPGLPQYQASHGPTGEW